MNIVKSVVKAVWPVIYNVLKKKVQDTETPFDDIALAAVQAALEEWLNDTQLDVEFHE